MVLLQKDITGMGSLVWAAVTAGINQAQVDAIIKETVVNQSPASVLSVLQDIRVKFSQPIYRKVIATALSKLTMPKPKPFSYISTYR